MFFRVPRLHNANVDSKKISMKPVNTHEQVTERLKQIIEIMKLDSSERVREICTAEIEKLFNQPYIAVEE